MKFPKQIFLFLGFFQIFLSQEIGVDIMPASHYIMNKQDMQRLRDEINHDVSPYFAFLSNDFKVKATNLEYRGIMAGERGY